MKRINTIVSLYTLTALVIIIERLLPITRVLLQPYDCETQNLPGNLCQGLFINDYYAGNLIFFVGGVMMNAVLLVLASQQKMDRFNNKDMAILLINSLVYAFTWFAYAAFDVVLLGLYFAALLAIISIVVWVKVKRNIREYPYITYSVVAYTLATIATIIYRIR